MSHVSFAVDFDYQWFDHEWHCTLTPCCCSRASTRVCFCPPCPPRARALPLSLLLSLPASRCLSFSLSLSLSRSLFISLALSLSLSLSSFENCSLDLCKLQNLALTVLHVPSWLTELLRGRRSCRRRRAARRSATSTIHGTHKTVRARFRSWLSGKSPLNVLMCPLFAWAQTQLQAAKGSPAFRDFYKFAFRFSRAPGQKSLDADSVAVRPSIS